MFTHQTILSLEKLVVSIKDSFLVFYIDIPGHSMEKESETLYDLEQLRFASFK